MRVTLGGDRGDTVVNIEMSTMNGCNRAKPLRNRWWMRILRLGPGRSTRGQMLCQVKTDGI